jgi:hypothetical protein
MARSWRVDRGLPHCWKMILLHLDCSSVGSTKALSNAQRRVMIAAYSMESTSRIHLFALAEKYGITELADKTMDLLIGRVKYHKSSLVRRYVSCL